MTKKTKNENEYYVIDVLHILESLWQRAWIICLISILTGGLVLIYSMFFITPKYSSSIMLYVNNRSALGESDNIISSSDVMASQSLANTYVIILNNRTTLEAVIDRTGVDYTYETLSGMVKAEVVNETEVFKVTVTSTSAEEAQLIANGIAEVLPGRIEEVVEGSSMRVFDLAVVNPNKVSPNLTKNTIIGFAIGFLASCALFALIALFDDTIRGDDFLVQNYDVPILAKIPDLVISGSPHGKYYYYYNSYNSYSSYGPDPTEEPEADAAVEEPAANEEKR